MSEDGHFWILDLGSFRIIGIFYSQVQASTVVLANNSCISIVKLPIMVNIKKEPSDDIVLLLLDLDDDVCLAIDLFDTLSFPFRTPTEPLVSTNIYKIPHNTAMHETISPWISFSLSISSLLFIFFRYERY